MNSNTNSTKTCAACDCTAKNHSYDEIRNLAAQMEHCNLMRGSVYAVLTDCEGANGGLPLNYRINGTNNALAALKEAGLLTGCIVGGLDGDTIIAMSSRQYARASAYLSQLCLDEAELTTIMSDPTEKQIEIYKEGRKLLDSVPAMSRHAVYDILLDNLYAASDDATLTDVQTGEPAPNMSLEEAVAALGKLISDISDGKFSRKSKRG